MSELGRRKNLAGQKIGNWTVSDKWENRIKNTYWECTCICGKVKFICAYSLTKGRSLSCGCKPDFRVNNSAQKEVVNSYKKNARNRGLNFNLTDEQVLKLTQQNCYYCDCPPFKSNRREHKYNYYSYNGIDRKNNDEGYYLDNCVPCCKRCNTMKTNMNLKEFKRILEIILDNLKAKGFTDA